MLKDVYNRVTARIIEDLEKGVRPWLKPWNAGNTDGRIIQPLRHNGEPYRGINVLLLWSDASDKGFSSPYWMTFKQALALNACVRKGEHGSLVVYADKFKKIDADDKGDEIEREIPFLKAYTVFNTEQIANLSAPYTDKPELKGDPLPLIEHAEMFFKQTGATIKHGGNQAYYSRVYDRIQLPPPEAFRDAEAYASTKAHELVHWTKHESRLARTFNSARFGDSGYAREELVAELGASFLCAALAITPEPRGDHAAYLGHWLSVLKEDKKAIFSAASHAQKAVDFLHSLQPIEPPSPA